jgi:pantothenate kinase
MPDAVALTTSELVSRAAELAARGQRTLLGITGAPGAGKSTLASAILSALGAQAAVVGMDGFHLAQHTLVRLGREQRKGAPDTFDSFGYATLLRRLRNNIDPVVYAPLFRRDLEEPIANSVPVDRAVPLVITEGNYLLLEGDGWQDACRQLHQLWFLEVEDDERIERLIRRHQEFGKSPQAARAWATGSDQRNALIVQAARHRADLVVRVLPADGDE